MARNTLIVYVPLPDEPNWREHKELSRMNIGAVVDQKPMFDPLVFAKQVMGRIRGDVKILIPGTKFDVSGTRTGRGGGWYDRFLSAVPYEWQRIGILNESSLSSTSLERRDWDEPMDWLYIYDGSSWREVETKSRVY